MKKQQSGFTLIELMIVVAIIGILAAIAIPSYMDYTKKARASEGITALSPAKATISEYYLTEGSFPTSTQAAFALTTAGEDFGDITYTAASGKVEVTGEAAANLDCLTIALVPTTTEEGITWDCQASGDCANLAPASCR